MVADFARVTALLISAYATVAIANAEPVSVIGARPSALRNDGDGWRPVRDSTKHLHNHRLPPPTSAYYVELGGVNKKHFRVDPSPSNKVEVFAPAPPSILGSFSGFGHDTVKSRHPVKHKKPYKEILQHAESRPGYPQDLLSPPYHRHIFSQPFKQPDNIGQAYYFEASLSPPPRDSGINFGPPPSSKVLAPNSYYLQFDQQTRTKPTTPNFNPYLRQNLPYYGTQDYSKPSSTSDPYRFYSPEPTTKQHSSSRPTNSHGRPPGIDYFGNNPFGDIHLSTNKHELKTPAKDVFEQLAPLGRPFQSSTIDPPRFNNQRNEFSSFPSLDYYTTPASPTRQTTPKPFRPSPLVNDQFPFTERPPMFVTPEPSVPLREIYPIPVTTLDIPSKDEILNKRPPPISTYQPLPNTQHYQEEATNKPVLTTYYKRPDVEVKNNGVNSYVSTPFLPTPSTDLDTFVGEPRPTELVTPYSETNELHNSNGNRPVRPRNRKKKPTVKPDSELYKENTSQNNFETPNTEYTIVHEDAPKFTTFDTLQNNFQTEQEPHSDRERYEENPKKRRPFRPNSLGSSSTFPNTESEVQEIPTVLSTLPEDDVRTPIPVSSSTAFEKTQQRRRKKPTNRVRGSSRHGLPRSTTTTTAEPPQDISSNSYSETDYQGLRETAPTENYPFSGLAFNEYGHVMLPNSEDSSSVDYNVNTLIPTQHIDEYQTSFHEYITSTTTEQATTTTTTPAPTTTTQLTTAKSRLRNKYNFNNTRPRFSVKDYRERLNKATSTTETPKDENEETHKETSRIRPPRLRGNVNYKPNENQEEQVETSTRRFKPSYTGQRHAYRTSTTQSPLAHLDTPTTTERQNTFKPRGQRRPGVNKYYSRYRTSTEEPTAAGAEQPSTEKLPQRPKGVFSAKKRRPFPLRSRLEPTKAPEEEDQVENTDNDLEHDQFTRKSDNVATTTLMTSSEEAEWKTSSAKPDFHALDSVDHGDITKKIADLTSSPSNSFDSFGFFKGASPSSSRRTVSQITLATEDPILPIEAFFSSSFNKNSDSR